MLSSRNHGACSSVVTPRTAVAREKISSLIMFLLIIIMKTDAHHILVSKFIFAQL